MCLGGVPAHWPWGAVLERDSSCELCSSYGGLPKTTTPQNENALAGSQASDTNREVESDLLAHEGNTSSKRIKKPLVLSFVI